MNQNVWKLLCCFLLTAAVMLSCAATLGQSSIPGKEKDAASVATATMMKTSPALPSPLAADLPGSPDLSAVEALSGKDFEGLTLYAGGMPFGVKFYTEGVNVVGISEVEVGNGKKENPAALAGLKEKDTILKVNGVLLNGAAELTEAIESSGGKPLKLLVRRGGREFETVVTPVLCPAESRYKTGIWVRDSGAGIGTVTFILPETGAFAGLGHGICDGDTGELIAMRRGAVSDVTITSVVRGAPGTPGELKGYFNAGKVGSLLGNSACGVWGVFSELPECSGEPLPVGLRSDVEEGDAYILCTLDNNKTCAYDVKISNVNRDAASSKCFTVTVTDPDLLAVTGGIVQGMSGSPIIQNGKLVGAVTHVLINDPTVGYGIFLENMLVNLPLLART